MESRILLIVKDHVGPRDCQSSLHATTSKSLMHKAWCTSYQEVGTRVWSSSEITQSKQDLLFIMNNSSNSCSGIHRLRLHSLCQSNWHASMPTVNDQLTSAPQHHGKKYKTSLFDIHRHWPPFFFLPLMSTGSSALTTVRRQHIHFICTGDWKRNRFVSIIINSGIACI